MATPETLKGRSKPLGSGRSETSSNSCVNSGESVWGRKKEICGIFTQWLEGGHSLVNMSGTQNLNTVCWSPAHKECLTFWFYSHRDRRDRRWWWPKHNLNPLKQPRCLFFRFSWPLSEMARSRIWEMDWGVSRKAQGVKPEYLSLSRWVKLSVFFCWNEDAKFHISQSKLSRLCLWFTNL